MGQTRQHERKSVTLAVRCRSTTTASSVFNEHPATDLSAGGLFVEAKQPLPVGTLLRFELDAGNGESVRGVGKVAWQRDGSGSKDAQPTGMGVQFVRIESDARDQIARLIRDR